MRVCVVFRGKFEVPVRSASPCYLYSRAHSLFLYLKIFAHRSTASWPQQNVLIFAKTNCHREIVTVKLTPWDHCNMIGPFTTFEFSSQNVLDGNHDVLVIQYAIIKMFWFSTGKIFCKENVVLLGKVSLVKKQPKMVCGVRWSTRLIYLRRVKSCARAIASLSLTGLHYSNKIVDFF